MASLGDFRILTKLGEGSFAEVFKVKCNRTGNVFAIKRLKKRYRSLDEVTRLPEVLALKALRGHPNIIDLVDTVYDQSAGHVAMVFELMDSNLYEFITASKRFDEATSLLLVYQLLKAIAFMHSRGLFHRDIKPENCMVNKDSMVLKLVDFGSTRGLSTTTAPYTEYVSTRWYRALECILTSGSYGPEVDEWAIGCMLYELLTGKPLFPGKHEIDMISKIHILLGTPSRDLIQRFKQNPNHQISFTFPQRLGQDLHKILPRVSHYTIDLLSALLVYNPQQRTSAGDALNMECFASFREAEQQWEATDMSIPFPVFYSQNNRPVPSAPPKIASEVENCAPAANAVFVPPAPEFVVPVPPKPAFVPPNATFLLPSEAALAPVKPPPAVVAPKPMIELADSRVRASQRIKAYRDAMKAAKARKPGYLGGAAIEVGAVKPSGFPRPRPDIVQPRLPRIVL
jgi:renal tumor antigen